MEVLSLSLCDVSHGPIHLQPTRLLKEEEGEGKGESFREELDEVAEVE